MDSPSARTPAAPAAVELRGLVKRYRGVAAVDGIDLDIPRGQVLALLGPNGAGKSTTMEAIVGLTAPDEGSARIFGMAPAAASGLGLVGAMLQNGALHDGVSVRTMLGLVRSACAHPIPLDEAVERAGIGELLSRSTSKLSGGQAQRVRFAMALLPDPDLLLLDEPTVGMDVETRREFWRSMHEIADGGRTIVFATHYLDEADEAADRIVVLDRGAVVADGTGPEIRRRGGMRTVTLAGAAPEALLGLDGVTGASRLEDGRVRLVTRDSDATLRGLFAPGGLGASGAVRGIEVAAPRLEDAFLSLTRDAGEAQP